MQHDALIDLLDRMTLEEKVGQLVQLTGDFYSDQADARTGPMAQLGVKDSELANVGTVLGVSGAEECARIQRSYMARNRLHIPTMFMADIIHGYRTIFPITLAIGASWNTRAAETAAEVSAREASAAGLSLTFSPMVDLVRDPRWGRVMESTGEDPYLNARMAEAFVHGYQGDDLLGDTSRVAACVKHFAGYGAPVAGREYNTVNMSERQLRDMYLPGYRAAIAAGAKTVMTAFNTVDGIPATGNRHLMRDILRGEWGFDGVLISDFNAVRELEAHGVAADDRQAADLAMHAGVDIEMMSICYMRELPGLIREGLVDASLVDEAVLRILTLKNDLGLFEHPFRGVDPEAPTVVRPDATSRAAARRVAAQSAVLLANHGSVLPLRSFTTVALLGPVARSHDVLGSWSAQGVPAEAVSLADGLQEAARRHDIDLEVARYGQKPEDYTKLDDATFQEAVALARRADVVVLALGEPSAMSGEASSRTDIRLPQAQVELFDAVRAVNPHVVVVLSNGRPLDLGQIDGAQAILESWFLGTESGAALADILCGDTNPSGRLSMSFPESVGQVPVYYNGDTTGRPYEVAPQEKYVSKYLDAGNYARYPFGFGLSYSHFVYGEPELTSTTFDAEHALEIAVDVTNDSDADGVDVVQLYVRDPVAAVVRPVRELKGFHRVAIAAHETVTVRFTLCERDVRYVHPDLAERSDPGDFLVSVGPNSRDLNSPMTVRLTETAA